ncbi:hypothetical protein E4U43_001126 [Claviceps pusilla]|uniref:Uncharacterized protein n=1 Tax=Claviceps pusilla TaxID=123648 RepID=A0A9P7SZF4_9HYPO|nr:hypothetical protein E4U43_001126 [Claviceps pusilla]
MSRLASPAIGCHLNLVEVQVGDQVETYNATTFDQPLEFNLQGQRSLASEPGILLLVISTGSKQMLSLRLNDLLNYPSATEETIAIDKQAQRLCVRLPNLNHTLRVWFRNSRDFLLSVCILRKTGFTIEEGPSSPLAKTFKLNRPTKLAGPPSLSTITPLAALPKQARDCPAPCGPLDEDASTPCGNIFDEVLDRLNQAGKHPDAISKKGPNIPAEPEGSTGALLLNSCHASGAKRKRTTDQIRIDSSQRDPNSHENSENQATSEVLNSHFHGATTDPPPLRRHHGYFTRSVSLAAGRLSTNVNNEEQVQSVRRRNVGKRSTRNACMRSLQDEAQSIFGTNQITDFRNLMPRRRSLPFLEAKHHSQRKMGKKADERSGSPRTAMYASNKTEMQQGLSAEPLCSNSDILMLLMDVSTLDELETRSSHLYKQYEQDISDGHHNKKRGGFYLDSLENLRTNFWLEKLQKVSGSDREAWTRS